MTDDEMEQAIREMAEASPPSPKVRRGAHPFLRRLKKHGYVVHTRAKQLLECYFGTTLSRDLGPPGSFWIKLTCGVDARPAGLFGRARLMAPPPHIGYPNAVLPDHVRAADGFRRFDAAFLRELLGAEVCLVGGVYAANRPPQWGADGWIYSLDDGRAVRICDAGWHGLLIARSLEELWYRSLFADTKPLECLMMDVPEIRLRQKHYRFF